MGGFYIAGGRTAGDLIELTVCILEGQGHVELEADVEMDALVVELQAVLAKHSGCILVPGDPYARDAEQLARCWCQDKRWAWEQRAPRFECACGVEYGLENSGWHGHTFNPLDDDGTFSGQPVSECSCGRDLVALRAQRQEAEDTGRLALFE